jgi:hypothetical protein
MVSLFYIMMKSYSGDTRGYDFKASGLFGLESILLLKSSISGLIHYDPILKRKNLRIRKKQWRIIRDKIESSYNY